MDYLTLLPAYIFQWVRATREIECTKTDDMMDFDSVMINALGYGFMSCIWENIACYKD